MPKWFRARGSDGAVAIYEGDLDDLPLNDPQSYMSRVLFHSNLLYPAIIREESGTLTLPARGANAEGGGAYNLFAHGQAGTPLVIGYATLSGTRVGLCGSVPVQMTSVGWARWISLGADATYVRIAEYFASQNTGGFSSISVPWTAYVLDTKF